MGLGSSKPRKQKITKEDEALLQIKVHRRKLADNAKNVNDLVHRYVDKTKESLK